MKSRSLFCAALAALLLLLSACGHPASEAGGAAEEELSAADTITPEEGAAILEKQLGAVDEATEVVAVHLGHHNPPPDELDRLLTALGARAGDDGEVVSLRARGR